jgi:hypothetical protein
VIRQRLLAAPITIVPRHLAQFTLIGFRRRLVRTGLEWDYDPYNQEIVTSHAILGAKPLHLLSPVHVIRDDHAENSLRPRLPLSL